MKKIIVFCILLFFISSCNANEKLVTGKHDFFIPNADIVFSTIEEPENGEYFGDEILGFYSFNNHEIEYININENLITPYYLDSESLVAIDKLGNPGSINEYLGVIFFLSNRQFQYCTSAEASGGDIHVFDGNILISNVTSINLINSKNCELMKTVIEAEDLTTIESSPRISTYDLSNNGVELLISFFSHKIVRVNLPEKDIYKYQFLGMNPTFSPDETQIAYLGCDGIHVINVNGEDDRLIIRYQTHNSDNDDCFSGSNPPAPQWSPDGKRLVYHKCNMINTSCSEINDYDIFMYDFDNGIEKLIIHRGLHPSWNFYKD